MDDMNEYVLVGDLARRLGMDKSHLRKWLITEGFSFQRVRTTKSGNQVALALTKADAEKAMSIRKKNGFSTDSSRIEPCDEGVFYLVLLCPDLSQRRIKLGFASDMATRLQAHRTAAPTADVVKCWKCKRQWEQTAIDSVTRTECVPISNEVYDCDSLEKIIIRCNEFFSLMPLR